jgi:murein DD-endopeptidase MepM/ murein hydrolase activator NlpD
MSYRFVNQPLVSGLYEPEGIYLSFPFRGTGRLLQTWGANAEFYRGFEYNGVQLKGHTGLDFAVEPQAEFVAVDQGRVVEISREPGGFERYIKIEHRWGESLYAFVGRIHAESGQLIVRGATLATAGEALSSLAGMTLFHFAIRISPFNRFDGYGGFTDPLPFLNPSDLAASEPDEGSTLEYSPHKMAEERPSMRRP